MPDMVVSVPMVGPREQFQTPFWNEAIDSGDKAATCLRFTQVAILTTS